MSYNPNKRLIDQVASMTDDDLFDAFRHQITLARNTDGAGHDRALLRALSDEMNARGWGNPKKARKPIVRVLS
jgi:hypothetical protein